MYGPRVRRDVFPLAFGVVVSTLLAGTLVIAGLKAGITPGVSPLVILCAWGAFNRRIAAGGGTRFLNLAQVAGSAGMAVTAGVIFTAPLVQILHADKGLEVPPVDVATLILLSTAGALIGFGFVGLGTRKFLLDPTLPAPEARACETMIQTAVTARQLRPRIGRSLYAGVAASFAAPLLTRTGIAREHIVLLERENDGRTFTLDLPFAPIYIGIGGLLTLATALLVFGGSMLRLMGDWMLAGVSAGSETAALYPGNSMRWVGGGAMTVAVAYSLKRFVGARSEDGRAAAADPLVDVDSGQRRLQYLAIVLGMFVLSGWLIARDGATRFSFAMTAAVLVCASLMVVLGAILSLQIGSSASPVSGTIFVTTLVLCLVALAVGRTDISDVRLLTPLLVGACVAVCTANDSSQDYKTMQLCGVAVQDGFLAQLLGLLGGCLVVPIVLYIAHDAYALGSEELVAPQGQMFATLVDGLLLQSALPWRPIFVGLSLGVMAVIMESASGRVGLQLPSMALAVGIYLPAYLGVGILIGSLARFVGERRGAQRNESILAAAGLITGAALLDLILGVLIVFFGFQESSLVVTRPSAAIQNTAGLLGIALLGGLLYANSRRRAP